MRRRLRSQRNMSCWPPGPDSKGRDRARNRLETSVKVAGRCTGQEQRRADSCRQRQQGISASATPPGKARNSYLSSNLDARKIFPTPAGNISSPGQHLVPGAIVSRAPHAWPGYAQAQLRQLRDSNSLEPDSQQKIRFWAPGKMPGIWKLRRTIHSLFVPATGNIPMWRTSTCNDRYVGNTKAICGRSNSAQVLCDRGARCRVETVIQLH